MLESQSSEPPKSHVFTPIVKPQRPEVNPTIVASEQLSSGTGSSHTRTNDSQSSGGSYEVSIRSEVPFGLIRDHFTCALCKGILVDVCTIIECLHSFCRSCVIHHIYKSTKCPTCGCQLNEVLPMKDIKPDPRLQDLVCALFPDVVQSETKRRTDYYWEKGLAPPVDKVYIDTHNSIPPSDEYLEDSSHKYDHSRVNLLHTKSNKVWFKAVIVSDNTSNKKFLQIVEDFNTNHSFIACPSFAKIGALYLAINKKLQLLGTKKLKLNINILYEGNILEKHITVREFYACMHNYGEFPVLIKVEVQPVFGASKVKKIAQEIGEAETENSTKNNEENIFGNLESFFDDTDGKPEKVDENVHQDSEKKCEQKTTRRLIKLRRRNKSQSEENSTRMRKESYRNEMILDKMRSMSAEEITDIFEEKELVVLAQPVNLKKFLESPEAKPRKRTSKSGPRSAPAKGIGSID